MHLTTPSAHDMFAAAFSKQKAKTAHHKMHGLVLKSGDYLSSQRLAVSTFGVKELNFCVRNGNRWILFAIITAMVIYLCFFQAVIHTTFVLISRLSL